MIDPLQADASAPALSEKFNDPIDLAAKLFRAERAMSDAQEEIEEALVKAGIFQSLTRGWEDWWHDNYDTSIEIKFSGANVALTDEHLMALHDMGFSRVWTHGSDGELFYSTKPRVPGAELNISNEPESEGVSLKSVTSSSQSSKAEKE